jgi:putative transposase
MLMLEFKLKGTSGQYRAIDEAIRTTQFIRNKCVRHSTQECSRCGTRVTKTLSQRTHVCLKCGLVLGRDHNAARTILGRGLTLLTPPTAGHAESHAWGEQTRYAARSAVLRKASR